MTKKKLLTVFILFLLSAIIASVSVVMYLRSIDIHRAAMCGDLDKVKRILLKKPEFLEARDELGYTSLHLAALMGYQDIAEMLIAKGADVNATDEFGGIPLHVAINTRYDTLNMSKSNNEGQLYSIIYEETKIKMVSPKVMVEFLIASGADVNATDSRGDTPLHKAADEGLADVAKILIANDSDVNAKAFRDETPLHKAVDDVDVAKILILNGADVNAKSLLHGLTPLHDAAYVGQEEVVKILIDNGAEVNTKTLIEGNTALHRAVFCGENSVSVCKVLIERGADVNVRNSAGATPLQQAIKLNETQVVTLLREHGGIE